jgi:hypothetical protein
MALVMCAQEVHRAHFVDGGIMTVHCMTLGAAGVLTRDRSRGVSHLPSNHLISWTDTVPPVIKVRS